MSQDRIDKCLLMLGEHTGLLQEIRSDVKDQNKRLKSLETTRTRQFAVFGLIGSAWGWLMSPFK